MNVKVLVSHHGESLELSHDTYDECSLAGDPVQDQSVLKSK